MTASTEQKIDNKWWDAFKKWSGSTDAKINKRIDELLPLTINEDIKKEERDNARLEAKALSFILLRRGGKDIK
jgi:predicted metal-dependent peptidase